MSRFSLRFVVSALVVIGCASHEGSFFDADEKSQPAVQLKGSIASVQLIQDCPDPVAPPPPAAQPVQKPVEAMEPPADEDVPAAGAPMPGAAQSRMAGDSNGHFQQPCTQSTMQLLLSHDSTEAHSVTVDEVRLLRASDSRRLGTLKARGPSKWNQSGIYEPWDQRVGAGTQMNVSYRLGEPDWSKVEKELGTPDTYGQRYVLEVDVVVAGRKTTLRSPEFSREYPHVVVT